MKQAEEAVSVARALIKKYGNHEPLEIIDKAREDGTIKAMGFSHVRDLFFIAQAIQKVQAE